MKSTLKLVTFFVVIFFSTNLYAQKEDYYKSQIRHIYSTLDTTELETGLFADIAFPFKEMKIFDGSPQQKRTLNL